ncbi:MAG: hypothetical protein CVU11_12175 [Bacteroidetes bacterium HGW-Bacteroidetes-6]|jgi:hypothetical protein|nr:MAG: hypothetical protein CVU11_12175 [Bacteroidetes bacterium HGW-Bacteroidetes-6]
MKLILTILCFFPLIIVAQEKNDSSVFSRQHIVGQLNNNANNIDKNKRELDELKNELELLEKVNERILDGVSRQLEAASYNLTIFGLLFAIAAIILGVYITRIESKVVRLSEENKTLLNQTEKSKEEVVAINNLIQKDIYGLFTKIKREETVHMLNRLSEIPKDINNLLEPLISRELEKEDFKILKLAYLKIKELPSEPRPLFSTKMSYPDSYKLVFFQHFLDLAIRDKDIGKDFTEFYKTGIACSFENDIVKSTQDFINAIVEMGYKPKKEEIGSFMKGLSVSKYKDFNDLYVLIFDSLKCREDRFEFFNFINDDLESRQSKSNFGKQLVVNYSSENLTANETEIIKKTETLIAELEQEEEEAKAKAEAEIKQTVKKNKK